MCFYFNCYFIITQFSYWYCALLSTAVTTKSPLRNEHSTDLSIEQKKSKAAGVPCTSSMLLTSSFLFLVSSLRFCFLRSRALWALASTRCTSDKASSSSFSALPTSWGEARMTPEYITVLEHRDPLWNTCRCLMPTSVHYGTHCTPNHP